MLGNPKAESVWHSRPFLFWRPAVAAAAGRDVDRPMMGVRMMEYRLTAAWDRIKKAYVRALEVPWDEIERVLGRPHQGTPEDDQAVVRALLDAGAPAWIVNAEGWVDDRVWGVIQP